MFKSQTSVFNYFTLNEMGPELQSQSNSPKYLSVFSQKHSLNVTV